METLKILCLSLLGITAFMIFIFALKSKKPFKVLLFNAFMGLTLLAIIDLTSKFTGVYIPINEYTVTGSAVFSIPALCAFLAMNFIFV